MLHSILNNSRRINLAGETHYFDDLRPRVNGKRLHDMSEAKRNFCLDYFRSLDVRPYGMAGDPNQSSLSRHELLKEASNLGGGVDCLFQAYCQWRTREHGTIWGEKTPRHVFRINEILDAFPAARIICILRDPRGVVASYRDWTYQGGLPTDGNPDYERAINQDHARIGASYNIVIASIMWRAAANSAHAALQKHGSDRVRIVKYEHVIEDPMRVVAALFSWLGVDFSEEMLNIPIHNSATTPYLTSAGLKKSISMRWRTALNDQEIYIIQKVTQKAMKKFAYEPLSVKVDTLTLPKAYLTVPSAVIRAIGANRSRQNTLWDYILRRLKAALM